MAHIRFYLLLIMVLMMAWAGLGVPARSEPTQDKIETIERDIEKRQQRKEALTEKAAQIQTEIDKLRVSARQFSAQLKALHQEQKDLAARLDELSHTEAALSEQLSQERESLVQALAALQILRADPPPAFATHPDDALKAIQGSIALAQIVPALRDRAADLKSRLNELTALRRRIDTENIALQQAVAQADRTRQKLTGTLKDRNQAERQIRSAADQEAAAIAKLVARARNLRELSRELARRQKSLVQKQTEFSSLRSALPLPIDGKITQFFGATLSSGQKSQGIAIAASQGAQIIAPYDGTILYAGNFRKYGKIIIIGIDQRYQLLLAGLDESFGVVGQTVLTGEPLGFLSEKGDETGPPPLYMEIRDQGRPVDPLPWMKRG